MSVKNHCVFAPHATPCARLLELALGECGNVSGCSQWLRLADAKRSVRDCGQAANEKRWLRTPLAVQMCAACTSVVEPGLGYSTEADTGDCFFSYPSLPPPAACDLSLQTLLVALTSALKAYSSLLLLPRASLQHLHFVRFAATCLRVSRYAVSLLSAHFLPHVRLPGLAPYLLARVYAVACTFSPTHRIRLSWTPGCFTTLCVIDDFGNGHSHYKNYRFGILLSISSVGHQRCSSLVR